MIDRPLEQLTLDELIALTPKHYFEVPDYSIHTSNLDLFNSVEWNNASLEERIALENTAINSHLQARGSEYFEDIKKLAGEIEMDGSNLFTIVIPAYNEQLSIPDLMRRLNDIQTQLGDNKFEVQIVLNCPWSDESEVNRINLLNIHTSERIIKEARLLYPHLDIKYVVKIPTTDKAGVGFARTYGHDLAMLRSLNRDSSERVAPFYILTLDADTPTVNSSYFEDLVNINQTGQVNLARTRGEYNPELKKKFPLLYVLEILWEDSFSTMANNTSNPWTIGRGIFLQAYAHASSNAVMGRENGGAGEDVRMGINIKNLPNSEVVDLEDPGYVVNPRRELLMITGLVSAIADQPGIFNRDIHEYARTLRSYLNFEDPRIRGLIKNLTEEIEQPESIDEVIDTNIVEVMFNSWWYLVRTEYLVELMRKSIPRVQELYSRFTTGEINYPEFQQLFNNLELEIHNDEIASYYSQVNQKATEDMIAIAERHGIVCQTMDIHPTPQGVDLDSPFPKPIKVLDISRFINIIKNK